MSKGRYTVGIFVIYFIYISAAATMSVARLVHINNPRKEVYRVLSRRRNSQVLTYLKWKGLFSDCHICPGEYRDIIKAIADDIVT